MAMNFRPEDNPLYHVWKRNYSFTYWDNKIEKISRYNSEDRLESLYVLMQLSDLYTHLFTVEVRNPNQPWFMVTEETYGNQIRNTLQKLEEEDTEYGSSIYVSNLLDDIEGLISMGLIENDVSASERGAMARDLFGLQAPYNEETNELEYEVDPDAYLSAINATLNFWRDNKPLLNDLKHGFRVLPFDTVTVDYLHEQGFFPGDRGKIEDFKSRLQRKEDDRWGIPVARLVIEQEGDQYEVRVDVHYVDSEVCLRMAKLVKKLLYNLFYPHDGLPIEQELINLVSVSDENPHVLDVIEHMGSFDIYHNPTASTEEDS